MVNHPRVECALQLSMDVITSNPVRDVDLRCEKFLGSVISLPKVICVTAN